MLIILPKMVNINTVGGYLHSQSPLCFVCCDSQIEKKKKNSMLKLKDNLRSSLLDLGSDHGFHAEFE